MHDKPVIVLPIADTHTGSTVGLHPNYIKRDGQWVDLDTAGGWRYTHNEHYYLNSKQKRIWQHYETGIKEIAKLRSQMDADLLIVGMGDVIDGDHHYTHQLTTRYENEQVNAFISILEWTLDILNYNPETDQLAFVEGTESHTRDNEEEIASRLPAMKFHGGYACTSFLQIYIHGKLFWFFHHGVSAGYSYAGGGGLYTFLKQIYFDRIDSDKPIPHYIMTGHTHKYNRQIFTGNRQQIEGVILAPFQEKTRFTNKLPRAIVHETKLGFCPVVVSPGGTIQTLSPYLFEMPLGEVLKW